MRYSCLTFELLDLIHHSNASFSLYNFQFSLLFLLLNIDNIYLLNFHPFVVYTLKLFVVKRILRCSKFESFHNNQVEQIYSPKDLNIQNDL